MKTPNICNSGLAALRETLRGDENIYLGVRPGRSHDFQLLNKSEAR